MTDIVKISVSGVEKYPRTHRDAVIDLDKEFWVGDINLNNGLKGLVLRRGNTVTFVCETMTTSARSDGETNLGVIIPEGYRPTYTNFSDAISMHGATMLWDSHIRFYVPKTGNVYTYQKNIPAETTVYLCMIWDTSDDFPM